MNLQNGKVILNLPKGKGFRKAHTIDNCDSKTSFVIPVTGGDSEGFYGVVCVSGFSKLELAQVEDEVSLQGKS